ncbi:site-specific integrase [Clostridium sp. DJ247]|uniref:tyrosine-type recombinase/integrase n=1 Tax=Clostridium sp. DJ247 TaxID=2726188 RepID=UPI001627E689|nr:site-specific integrase [Clostridium sp. DJ247]MBC2579955.1 tyrosine-type recombinase/integrase [Clostridium sp. DJ247]
MKRGEVKGTQLFKQKQENKKTYKELLEEFILSLKVKGRSEYTLRSYKYHSKYFAQFLGEDTLCNTINLKTLEDYILYIQDVKKITNGVTINSYLRNIGAVVHFGIRKRYILEDFEIPVVKYQETFKEIYTKEELHDLLEKPKKQDFNTIRTWTIIWTFASTGVRARELRELKVKGVDLLNRTITVNATKNKKARYLPISNSLAEVLTEYLEVRGGESDDYLFPTVYGDQLAQSTLQKSIKIYCNTLGIQKCSLHLFRHTFITNAVNQNVSPLILKRITGHSTLKELNRYYNAKTTDMVNVIDDIAPQMSKKESVFKKSRRK